MRLLELRIEFFLVILPFLFISKMYILHLLRFFIVFPPGGILLRHLLIFVKNILILVIRELFILMSESCVPPWVSERMLKNYIFRVIWVFFFSETIVVLLFKFGVTQDIVSFCYQQKIFMSFVIYGLLEVRVIQFSHPPILILDMIEFTIAELF